MLYHSQRSKFATQIAAGLLSACAAAPAMADVKLPAIFSDHMVLQAGANVPVWGWAEPGEAVEATINGQTKKTTADDKGNWKLQFEPLKASAEPTNLVVKGRNELTVGDVLVGEVWLASGQSNMAMDVARSLNAEEEKSAATHPKLRMFTVVRTPKDIPQADCKGSWAVCSPSTVGSFSAVAYFFGRELHQRLDVPVGMINTSYGGTDIASWTSAESQNPIPELKAGFDRWAENEKKFDPAKAKADHEKRLALWKENVAKAKAAGKEPPRKPQIQIQPSLDPNWPAHLFNGMLHPLVPFAIRGVIWYQGEHNCSTEEKAKLYSIQLPLLVADWRKQWGSELPFAWVQLPNFDHVGFRPLVREAMLKSLSVKNTGMAIAIDVGEAKDNHPRNKQEVGRRLSLWALGTVYGQKFPSISGPLFDSQAVNGGNVILKFKHADNGLVAKEGELKGFEIAGADKQYKPAVARIEGSEVIVSSPDVAKPAFVRYAWSANPDCNLCNGAGLPASPFRTE